MSTAIKLAEIGAGFLIFLLIAWGLLELLDWAMWRQR